jgi:hypothetical protein
VFHQFDSRLMQIRRNERQQSESCDKIEKPFSPSNRATNFKPCAEDRFAFCFRGCLMILIAYAYSIVVHIQDRSFFGFIVTQCLNHFMMLGDDNILRVKVLHAQYFEETIYRFSDNIVVPIERVLRFPLLEVRACAVPPVM